MYRYNKKTLSNGLKIVAYKMPQMKSVALGIWIATGGRYENIRNRGISHFVEHLLFKGTKKRTAAQIKNSIEGVGGSLNGFTSEEATCYLIKVLGRHLKLGLDVLGDMVLNAAFDPGDIDKERLVILEEIKMCKDHPDSHVNELLVELMWPGQNLGIPLMGTFETVNSFERKDIIAYRDKSYNPSNITIVACGDVDWHSLFRDCERIFSKRKKGKLCSYEKMKISQSSPRTNILNKDTEQTHIAVGFHSPSRRNPARYAMDLLNIVLGANMSSRLFHQLREKKGLAYTIGSHLDYYADGGAMLIEAGVDNRKISDAIQLMLRELSKIKRNPITKRELEGAKEYYQGHLLFLFEDTVSHMLWVGKRIVTDDEPIDKEEILNRIKKITMDDILKLSAQVFRKENLNIAIIGPTGEKEKEIIEIAQEL